MEEENFLIKTAKDIMYPFKILLRNIREAQARKFISDIKGKSILDIGCADKHFFHKFKRLKTSGIDLSYGQDVQDGINFPNGSFDYVTMIALIEHIKKWRYVLSECQRVLKTGGILIITTPKKEAEKFNRMYNNHIHKEHYNYFVKEDFSNIKGFKLVNYSTFDFSLNQLIVLKKTSG